MRYVTPDGSFWEVTLTGRVVRARWGKGASVKTRESTFRTVELAKAELASVEKKVRKLGYRLEGAKPDGIAEALRARPTDDSPLIVHGDELLSQGDLRGELAALVLLDAVVRLLPGVMGHAESGTEESFETGLLEYPHYTRPQVFEGLTIPEILVSGDHQKIAKWRRAEAERITRERRPDLWAKREG